jgi:hypothetical protein
LPKALPPHAKCKQKPGKQQAAARIKQRSQAAGSRAADSRSQPAECIGHIGNIAMQVLAGRNSLAILSFEKHWQYCHLKNIGNIVI